MTTGDASSGREACRFDEQFARSWLSLAEPEQQPADEEHEHREAGQRAVQRELVARAGLSATHETSEPLARGP